MDDLARDRSRRASPTRSARRGASSRRASTSSRSASSCFFRQWPRCAAHANAARHRHHRRHADLRRPRQRRRVGAPRPVPARRATAARRSSPACRRTTSAPPASCGATRSTTGRRMRATATRGGSRASGATLRAGRHRAPRPLPRLRGATGRCRPTAETADQRRAGSRARARRCSTLSAAALGEPADHRRGPRRDHAGGRGAARRSSASRAWRILQFAFGGDTRQPLPAAQLHERELRRLHRHARQRHDASAGGRRGAAKTTRSAGGTSEARARARRVPGHDGDEITGTSSALRSLGGRHRHRAAAGRARTSARGAHEHAGRDRFELALAVPGGPARPRHAKRLAELTALYGRA